MMKRLTLLLFVASVAVAYDAARAQSSLTTPDTEMQETPANAQGQFPNAEQQPTGREDTDKETLGSLRLGTKMPVEAPGRMTTQAPESTRIAGPLKTRSEFEQYAEDATGRRLPVYGRQLFDQAPTTFAPVEDVPVPADYVLGPDDQLLIRAWGKIEMDARVTVDRNGQITLPRVGTLTVAGLRSAEVEGFLRSAIGGLFKDFELNVALGKLRSIQIFVLGEARQPGSYTVSSLSTLVDAVFTSGGPSATGTMRHIELRRDGKTVSEFDLYELLQKGDKSHDVRLLPGDVIFIPHIGPQIAISGDVNTPGIFELSGTNTVGSALENAGGMTSLADGERVVLQRIEAHRSRAVEEFQLDDAGNARPVRDGDLLRVFPLSPKFANAITLRGNVAVPGLFPWKEGMRVSDLIPSRASLITRDYWNRQNHLVQPEREHAFANRREGAFSIQPGKRSSLGTMNETGDAQRKPNQDEWSNDDADQNPERPQIPEPDETGNQNTTDGQNYQPEGVRSRAMNAVGQNSAEINWEYALIERLDERDLSTRLIPFRLASAIDQPGSEADQLLKPGDVVTIFSRSDLELPMEKHASFIRVGGEVNAPGVYRVEPGETLRDVVAKAGGLTQHSYLYASIFTRVSTRISQEAQLRQSTEQMQRELVAKFANATPQAGQSGADQQMQLSMQQAALAKLSSIRPTGRVVLNMDPTAATATDIPAFPLEDGDTFYIPPRLSTVSVAGEVYNANAFRYEPGVRLISYLNAAGGVTRSADQKRMFVIRADGTVVSRQSRTIHSHGNYENLRLLPGDAIVVPEKLRVSSAMNEFLQTSQFMSQLALTAAALSVVK
jgi:polysaccharide export outer membrane protein